MPLDVVVISSPSPQIASIALNRPERRNALSIELMEKLIAAVDAASADAQKRVLMIHGNGPVFCAGLDLHEAQNPRNAHRSATALARVYQAICRSPLVTIAAAHGAAMGGGAGLISACDLAVAADDLKLSQPEVHRGLVAALVTCLLRRQLSDRRIRELILLGQTVNAAEALAMGLVGRVVPASSFMDRVIELAKLACQGAPGAVVRSKRLLDELAARPMNDELELALQFHLNARNSSEAAEGIAAFLEKRPPHWGLREQ